jgi:hypothetical protein
MAKLATSLIFPVIWATHEVAGDALWVSKQIEITILMFAGGKV